MNASRIRFAVVLIYALGAVLLAVKNHYVGPNFVVIVVDDLGYMDVGAYNPNTFYETPNLDRLAAEGVRFTDGYAASPVCSPTRASIVTGKHPARTRITDWLGAPQPETAKNHWTRNKPLLPASFAEQLPLNETTLAETFRDAGYRTFFAGKWHLGRKGSYPEDHGFEINIGGWEQGAPQGAGLYTPPYGNPKLKDGKLGEHLPDRLATEAANFIASDPNRSFLGQLFFKRPFLVFLSFYSVHTPLIARQDLEAKYVKKRKVSSKPTWGKEGANNVRLVQDHPAYAGMVEAMDQAVGKVMNALDKLGADHNTVVIFMSDNGGLSTSNGHPTSNLPLRAGKGWLYEGGIRVPMIVKWPSITEPGRTSNDPASSTDIYPTMLEIAELPANDNQHRDGASLVPVLKGKGPAKRRNLYWHYPHYGNQGGSPSSAIRSGQWKLIEFFEDKHVELYDLRNDVSEKTNLAPAEPEKVQELLILLQTWRQAVDARYPTPNPVAATSN